ncbi:MAG: zinc transporter, integral rane protein [Candidatus Parcubacteria bacterium]|jgi:zinc transport system permease protein
MLEIFQYDFMVRAFIAGVTISILAPLIGMFLVVRRYSLIADTLSHVSLIGVALSLIMGIHPIVGAIVTSVLAAIGMEKLRESKKIFGESVLAIFLSGSLAVAVILIGLTRSSNINFFAYLFGSITTVSSTDLSIIAACAILTGIILTPLYQQFFLTSYDEELAQANGLQVKLLNTTITILAAVVVSISMRIVGILLIGALMVIPVITAMQYRLSFTKTHILSVIISLCSCVIGLFLSYYLNLPSGGSIVVVSLIFFILGMFMNRS